MDSKFILIASVFILFSVWFIYCVYKNIKYSVINKRSYKEYKYLELSSKLRGEDNESKLKEMRKPDNVFWKSILFFIIQIANVYVEIILIMYMNSELERIGFW